jgi:hypothetical protein
MPRKNGASSVSGRFGPGNPGKPKGARHRVSLAVEALLGGEAEALTRKAIEAGLAGDITALRLCLERIAPAPKDRFVHFAIPVVRRPTDVPQALGALIAAVAAGELTPSEGAVVGAMIDRFGAAFEAVELELRVASMEAYLSDPVNFE